MNQAWKALVRETESPMDTNHSMLTISWQGLAVQPVLVLEVQVFGLLLHEPTRKSETSFSAFCYFPVIVQTKPSQCEVKE